MTLTEKKAFAHLGGTMKATMGRSDQDAQAEVKGGTTHFRRLLSDDPEVLRLAQDGYDAFVLRTGQRILSDNSDQIIMNRCPRCGSLARTPKARQCRFCRYDWHDELQVV